LVWLGFDKTIIPLLRRHDKHTYKQEWNGCFTTGKSKLWEFDTNNVYKAFFILKKRSNSNAYYDFGLASNSTNGTYGITQLNTLQPSNILQVNKYLDEKYTDIKAFINTNRYTLLKAPTGSGKSFLAVKLLKELIIKHPNSFLVLACDTVMLSKQIATDNNFNLLCGETNKSYSKPLKPGIYISTYDSLIHLHKIDFLVVDEAHQLINASDFRKKAINRLFNLMLDTKTLAITATPQYLYPLNNTFNLLEVDVKDRIQNTYEVVDASGIKTEKKILEIILHNHQNGKNKGVVYLNDNNKLKEIKKYLEQQTSLKIALINKDVKEDKEDKDSFEDCGLMGIIKEEKENLNLECYDSIVNNSLIPNNIDIVLTTCLLQNGINIKNNDIDYLIINEVEETSIIQFEARFRRGVKGKVYLLKTLNPTNEVKRFGYKEYKYFINKYENIAYTYNHIEQKKNSYEDQLLKEKSKAIYFNIDLNRWEVNKLIVGNQIYEQNRLFYQSNPSFFFNPIGSNGTNGTNGVIINPYFYSNFDETILDTIQDFYRKKTTEKREWYFTDTNSFKVNSVLGRGSIKNKSKVEQDFYKEHKDKIKDVSITYCNKRYNEIKFFERDFNYQIKDKYFKELLKNKVDIKYTGVGILFNYMVLNNALQKEVSINISTLKTAQFNLLVSLKNVLDMSKVYTWNELKEIYLKIYEGKNYKIFGISKSDNNITNFLNCLFNVKKKRIKKDEERISVFVLNEYVINKRFEGIFNSLNIRFLDNKIVLDDINLWFNE
jgi:hypothetical protein